MPALHPWYIHAFPTNLNGLAGKSTGHHRFFNEIQVFPDFFPWNQSSDKKNECKQVMKIVLSGFSISYLAATQSPHCPHPWPWFGEMNMVKSGFLLMKSRCFRNLWGFLPLYPLSFLQDGQVARVLPRPVALRGTPASPSVGWHRSPKKPVASRRSSRVTRCIGMASCRSCRSLVHQTWCFFCCLAGVFLMMFHSKNEKIGLKYASSWLRMIGATIDIALGVHSVSVHQLHICWLLHST